MDEGMKKLSVKEKSLILKDLYQNPKSNISFTGIRKLYNEARKINSKISIDDVKYFLQGEDSYTLHRTTKKKFPFKR